MLARPFKGARQPVTGMFLFLDLRRVANAAPSVAALSDAPPEIEGTRRPMEGSKRCIAELLSSIVVKIGPNTVDTS